MKKIFITLFAMALLLPACDKIEGPYISVDESVNTDVEFPDVDPAAVTRNILMEEFTGHKCPNCPEGQRTLANIEEQYGEQLITIAVHAGMFATPAASAGLPEDFRTEVGTALHTDYAISSYPSGVVNRSPYQNETALNAAQWQNAINAAAQLEPLAAVQIINVYDAAANKLTAHTRTTFITPYEGRVQLALYAVEDGIVAPQIDGTDTIPDYVHNHLLRCALNGTYGTQISEGGTVVPNESYTKSYELKLSDKGWNVANCSIVAILMDADTHKVLQVEKEAFTYAK